MLRGLHTGRRSSAAVPAAAVCAPRRRFAAARAAAANGGSGAAGNGAAPATTPTAIDLPDYEHAVDPEEFRAMGYRVVDWIADWYGGRLERAPVKPSVRPGFLRPQLPEAAPEEPESLVSDAAAALLITAVHALL